MIIRSGGAVVRGGVESAKDSSRRRQPRVREEDKVQVKAPTDRTAAEGLTRETPCEQENRKRNRGGGDRLVGTGVPYVLLFLYC